MHSLYWSFCRCLLSRWAKFARIYTCKVCDGNILGFFFNFSIFIECEMRFGEMQWMQLQPILSYHQDIWVTKGLPSSFRTTFTDDSFFFFGKISVFVYKIRSCSSYTSTLSRLLRFTFRFVCIYSRLIDLSMLLRNHLFHKILSKNQQYILYMAILASRDL